MKKILLLLFLALFLFHLSYTQATPTLTQGSSTIATPPPGQQNAIGEFFDFNTSSAPLTQSGNGSFGNFGQIYFNYDANNLYIGGHSLALGSENHTAILFLSLNTLTKDKGNLWSNTGKPEALDILHNIAFIDPADIAIIIDGANTANEWKDDMLIALDMANDDPRSLGSNWTMHEAPVDFTHAWAAWDDNHLYIAYQLADITDLIDPANAGSALGGKITNNQGILVWIAFDTIPNAGGSVDMWAKNNGQPLWTGNNKPDYQIYTRGDLWAGARYISKWLPALNRWAGDGELNSTYFTFAGANITVAKGDTNIASSLWGVPDADQRNNTGSMVNYIGHNKSRDSFYEFKIPLASLGLTRAQLEANGIGVMIGSALDTIPHDENTLNTQGVEVWNSSKEWSDVDNLTTPLLAL